jgi:F-type H+-transporting ATPase subunit delta
MKDKSIAKVYAHSFIELGKEKNIDVAKEVTTLTEIINSSNELENVLFLDVFTNEEKTEVFEAIAKKAELSSLLVECVKYLINEKRIGLFPLIFKEIIVIDDDEKGFLRGTIEGASDDISEEYKDKLMNILKQYIGDKKPVLTYKKSEDVTAGFKVTVDDLQLDASIDNQLRHFKEMIIGE